MHTPHMGYTAFIGKEWRTSTGAAFASLNPATGEIVWQGHEATKEDINDAVAAGCRALPYWSMLPAEVRAEKLLKLSSILQSEQSRYAEAIAKENGKPLGSCIGSCGYDQQNRHIHQCL
jgi:succinylglutamic semialdehyde dehydrogenase